MPPAPPASQMKRQRERNKRENVEEKTEKRLARKEKRRERAAMKEDGTYEDPDLAGIVPGPQPRLDDY